MVDKIITSISRRSEVPGQKEGVCGISPGPSAPGIQRETTPEKWPCFFLKYDLESNQIRGGC